MASDVNTSFVSGRLGSDPDRKDTGPTVFRLASNRWVPGKDGGEGREDTSWMSVTCWGTVADRVMEHYRKGSRVLVEGRIQTRSWEDPTTGKTREGMEIIASAVHLFGGEARRIDE